MATYGEMKKAVLSGLGIVVSILLAFAIDAAWDGRQERLQEDALVQGLRVEFAENLLQLDEMIAAFRQQDSLLVAFFDTPTPATEESARSTVEEFYLALLWADLFDPASASVDIIVNSGRLDLPSDPELRTMLWTWKRQVEDLEDDTDAFGRFIAEGRRILGDLGARGVREDLRPPWTEQVDRIRDSPEISALAQTVRIDRREYSDELEILRTTTAEVLSYLNSAG